MTPACYDDPDGYCPCEEPDLDAIPRIVDVPTGPYL